MKSIADNLAAAAQPVKDDHLNLYILSGLGPNYDALVVSVTSRAEAISIAYLHELLLSHETRLESLNLIEQGLAQVNLTIRNSNTSQKKENGFRKNTISNNNNGRFGRGRGRGRGRYNMGHGQSHNPTGSSQCQVCNKYGHTTLTCYHRFNHAYQTSSNTQMATFIAQPNTVSDPAWYPDFGATNHLTNDLNNVTIRGDYSGNEQIVVGNGTGLPIYHIGDSKLLSSSRSQHLKNILFVSEITKSLLSVAQFTVDNNVFFEIHPYFCLVKDRATGRSYWKGDLKMASTGFSPLADLIYAHSINLKFF
ncbi:uncharacterized protein [Solanum tuberosum]|uniref:uncharacterized protein n=1 Tax=Solanum tuberosum TaxID=4113 RepID=UPI00073A4B42|nr:PREDICTED: uncharacterized protein LOC107061943 [Solanum tuberosum]